LIFSFEKIKECYIIEYIMANRHLYRSIVLQTLYEWDINEFSYSNFNEKVAYITRSFLELHPDDYKDTVDFLTDLSKKRELIDEIIEKAAPDWPLSKMTIIDRNILRMGIYELIFIDNELVPAKVAINEAIELAKQFGGVKSGKFVNGVIGAVYRELGEPGKDEFPKRRTKDIPLEEMEIDKKGAAVVYSIDSNGVIRIGMVHDIFGYWTLSKGGIEEGETAEEGTIREVKEETNWDVEIIQKLGENEYIAYPPDRGPVRKQVQYFLAKSEYTKPKLEKNSGGLDDVRWFELSDISDLNMYDDVSKMLIKSIQIILSSKEDSSVNNNEDLSELSLTELKKKAKERGLSGYSTLKKDELLKLLS
jgi:N utilization substance protein B